MSGETALDPRRAPAFPLAARAAMGDTQLRKNVRHATDVIRAKRARVVGEMPDWEALRESGRPIRGYTMQYLGEYLEELSGTARARAGGALGAGCGGDAAECGWGWCSRRWPGRGFATGLVSG